MVPRVLRRRRRVGLLLSGSLLVAGFWYIHGGGHSSGTSASTSDASAHHAPAPAPAPPAAPATVPKKAAKPNTMQKPVLHLDLPPMAYGTNAHPPLKDLPHVVADLPREHVLSLEAAPTGAFSWRSSKAQTRRLVIIGDVHGQLAPLQELLAKVGFDKDNGDHLILAGDLVNKGPDSAGVVQLAMDLGASAVRGNHDDRLVLVNKAMKKPDAASSSRGDKGHVKVHTHNGGTGGGMGLLAGWFGMGDKKDHFTVTELTDDGERRGATKWEGENGQPDLVTQGSKKNEKSSGKVSEKASRGDEAFRALAATMTDAQLEWLSSLPAILRIGHIPGTTASAQGPTSSAPWNAEIVVVHAGLVPQVPLEKQDPWAVTHMRSFKYPAEAAHRAEVKNYLKKTMRVRNRGRIVPVREEEVDKELARLKKTLPPETWAHDRDVVVPDEGQGGDSWSEVWNEVQNNRIPKEEDRMVVIYGHDAKAGLQVDMDVQVEDTTESPEARKKREKEERAKKGWFSWWSKDVPFEKKTRPGTRYAFGLDSGCVYGKQLSALILEAGLEDEQGIVHKIIQVNCKGAVTPKDKKGKQDKGRH